MTARSTLTKIHSKLFQLITGLLLLAAVVAAESPVVKTSVTTPSFNPETSALLSAPTADEDLLSVGEEFHPEVGIGPPTRVTRTALRPEAGSNSNFVLPMQPGAPVLGGQSIGGRIGQQWNVPEPAPYAPKTPSQTERTPQEKIAARALDSRMVGFQQTASFNQIANLFTEASRMIDARHVNPPSYEQRTSAALANVAHAISSPEFLQANRVNPNPQAVAALQQELMQMAQSQPARSSGEALGLMQWAAEMASQRIGVRREAIALEFLNGTLDSLDRYSAFVPAKTQMGPSAALEERIVGIGVELKTHDRGVLVMSVIDNGPAAGAGLRKGDVIVAINGRSLGGLGLSQAADLIGGPQGSAVQMVVDRQGQQFQASVVRRSVYVSSVVDAKFLDSSRTIGYVRIKQFSDSTSEDLAKEMAKLHNAGMKSVVLDLRGNPGGLLTECVEVSDQFLPAGTIVMTKGRTSGDNSSYSAKRAGTWSMPLVVLVDDHSASASEIFAAAVQENGRGVVVGRNSYGKGTVQTHFPLQSVSGELKLTTAKFYSPSGREMSGHGVQPDVQVSKAPGAIETDEMRDPDLLAALRVMQGGRPAQLAQEAGQVNRHLGGTFGR
ncbi:Carboxy-terminal processing protease CtpB precursor [Caulifigura coniformis]|uniref:Carboxy-terminal processing protease CtpB n=1 Tax=Caulifigura coniformis TaxID=2527983 RepID=A0A517SG38_9PLAN|nr:S41 family peptidase [Caulifigura coniformis]QDT55037.1 Carboxy-terminal processing protease CtpB precursor [Caulifigura coniformis]